MEGRFWNLNFLMILPFSNLLRLSPICDLFSSRFWQLNLQEKERKILSYKYVLILYDLVQQSNLQEKEGKSFTRIVLCFLWCMWSCAQGGATVQETSDEASVGNHPGLHRWLSFVIALRGAFHVMMCWIVGRHPEMFSIFTQPHITVLQQLLLHDYYLINAVQGNWQKIWSSFMIMIPNVKLSISSRDIQFIGFWLLPCHLSGESNLWHVLKKWIKSVQSLQFGQKKEFSLVDPPQILQKILGRKNINFGDLIG